MADVVEQRRDLDVAGEGGRQLEAAGHALCDVEGTKRMAEPRVLRTRIDQPREAHLLDPAQPLHGAGVEQVRDRAVLALELDQAMDRIAEHAVLDGGHGGQGGGHGRDCTPGISRSRGVTSQKSTADQRVTRIEYEPITLAPRLQRPGP